MMSPLTYPPVLRSSLDVISSSDVIYDLTSGYMYHFLAIIWHKHASLCAADLK